VSNSFSCSIVSCVFAFILVYSMCVWNMERHTMGGHVFLASLNWVVSLVAHVFLSRLNIAHVTIPVLPLSFLQTFGFNSMSAIKKQDELRESAANVIQLLMTWPSWSRQNILNWMTFLLPVSSFILMALHRMPWTTQLLSMMSTYLFQAVQRKHNLSSWELLI